MRQTFLKALAIPLLLASTPAFAQDLIDPGIGARIASDYAQPALDALGESAAALATGIDGLCEAPGDEGLEAVRAQFADVVRDWGAVSVLRFGPLVADNRFERVFFWPDPRGIALRQIQGLLAEPEDDAASAKGLAGKSVALQGLPALEFVLFGTGSGELAGSDADFRCRYAGAIARNVATIAGDGQEGWAPGSAFHATFTEPAPDKDPYRSTEEVAGEVVKAAGTALQFMRNAELVPALGESALKANGRLAPLWRSDLTFALMAAQLRGLNEFFTAAGFEATLPPARSGIAASIRFEIEHALEAIETIDVPAENAFTNETARGTLNYVSLALHGASHAVNDQLSAAIGLVMGFNALDGD